ncbi:hypothetical protein ACTPD5_21165, partial [Clostridioides difficile]
VNIPVEKKENKLEILTLEQQKSFIKAIDGHKLEVLFLLALGTVKEDLAVKALVVLKICSEIYLVTCLEEASEVEEQEEEDLNVV